MKRITIAVYAMFSLILFCSDCSGSGAADGALLYYTITGINLIYAGSKLCRLESLKGV